MATVTRQIVQFNGGVPGAEVTWSYDYDDVSFLLLSFKCVNDSNASSRGTVTSQVNGRTASRLVAAHTTDVFPIPPAVQNFGIGVDGRGRLTGITHNFEWPAT